jgi:hypothetical protein
MSRSKQWAVLKTTSEAMSTPGHDHSLLTGRPAGPTWWVFTVPTTRDSQRILKLEAWAVAV